MDSNIFSISEVMFMIDIIREDKTRWSKIGKDEDVLKQYDSVISKLESRLKKYNEMSIAIGLLLDNFKKSD